MNPLLQELAVLDGEELMHLLGKMARGMAKAAAAAATCDGRPVARTELTKMGTELEEIHHLVAMQCARITVSIGAAQMALDQMRFRHRRIALVPGVN